jgi:VCBS repeat protein
MTTTPRPLNSPTQVNTTDGGTAQFQSEIAPLQDGGYVVVWTDASHTYNPAGEAIVAQRYNAAGNKVGGDPLHGGEVNISLSNTGDQFSPDVTVLSNGDVAVAFVDKVSGQDTVFVQVFDSSLHFVRSDFIDTGAFDPSLTATADGGYEVSYTASTATGDHAVARFVNDIGSLGGQVKIVNQIPGGTTQESTHVATLSDGNAVAVYVNGVPGHDTDIAFTIFTPAETPEQPNNPTAVPGADSNAFESQPDVAALHGGGFVAIWREPHGADTSEIRASIVGNDGLTDIASNILVNTTTGSNQDASVMALADGGFLVTWKDLTHFVNHGQRFDALGGKIGAEFTLPGGAATEHSHGALLTDDHIALAFDAFTSNFDVTTSVFTVDTPRDFNANGLSDILWQNDNGMPAIWQMNGASTVSNSPAGPFNPGPSWHVKDSGDFNGDGHADILWQNDDGTPAIWLMNGSNALSVGAAGSFNPGPSWQIKATGDFNGDGKSDILWQNGDGTPAIWQMNGLTVLSNGPVGPFNPGPTWHAKATGDFNGDGKSDILWQNDDGTPAIWLMNGSTVLSNSPAGPFNPGPSWHIKASGDFNGDGKSDILWQNDDGTPAIWLMNGNNAISVGAVGPFNPGPSWAVKATGDFNGDGKSDILWQSQDGTPAIWTMDGTHVLSVGVAGAFNPGADWHVI